MLKRKNVEFRRKKPKPPQPKIKTYRAEPFWKDSFFVKIHVMTVEPSKSNHQHQTLHTKVLDRCVSRKFGHEMFHHCPVHIWNIKMHSKHKQMGRVLKIMQQLTQNRILHFRLWVLQIETPSPHQR